MPTTLTVIWLSQRQNDQLWNFTTVFIHSSQLVHGIHPHPSGITWWAPGRLKSPVTPLFVKYLIKVNSIRAPYLQAICENVRASNMGSVSMSCSEFLSDCWAVYRLTFLHIGNDTAGCPTLLHAGLILWHYSDVIMGTVASQITSLTIVYSTVYSATDQRKY